MYWAENTTMFTGVMSQRHKPLFWTAPTASDSLQKEKEHSSPPTPLLYQPTVSVQFLDESKDRRLDHRAAPESVVL